VHVQACVVRQGPSNKRQQNGERWTFVAKRGKVPLDSKCTLECQSPDSSQNPQESTIGMGLWHVNWGCFNTVISPMQNTWDSSPLTMDNLSTIETSYGKRGHTDWPEFMSQSTYSLRIFPPWIVPAHAQPWLDENWKTQAESGQKWTDLPCWNMNRTKRIHSFVSILSQSQVWKDAC
jgi:hypothetical protein